LSTEMRYDKKANGDKHLGCLSPFGLFLVKIYGCGDLFSIQLMRLRELLNVFQTIS
jgi:hypothetical protein